MVAAGMNQAAKDTLVGKPRRFSLIASAVWPQTLLPFRYTVYLNQIAQQCEVLETEKHGRGRDEPGRQSHAGRKTLMVFPHRACGFAAGAAPIPVYGFTQSSSP